MIFRLISVLLYVSSIQNVLGNKTEDIINIGDFPYSAHLYYSDESEDYSRFLRQATLITLTHLVSSSVDGDDASDFLTKTMLARLGSLKIEKHERQINGETEQEVIQIIRPYNHSADKWWESDIVVVRVLEPFILDAAVRPATLGMTPRMFTDAICQALIFVRVEDENTRYVLRKVAMRVLPQSTCEDTGVRYFYKDKTLCSAEVNKRYTMSNDEEFCRVNAGSPLICDNEPIALKSYVKAEVCSTPYIYQRFAYWEKFIQCGIKNQCESDCDLICASTGKELPSPPPTTTLSTSTSITTTTITTTTLAIKLSESIENADLTSKDVELTSKSVDLTSKNAEFTSSMITSSDVPIVVSQIVEKMTEPELNMVEPSAAAAEVFSVNVTTVRAEVSGKSDFVDLPSTSETNDTDQLVPFRPLERASSDCSSNKLSYFLVTFSLFCVYLVQIVETFSM